MKQDIANENDFIAALLIAEEAKAPEPDMRKFLLLYFTDLNFRNAYHDYVWQINKKQNI